VQNLFTSLGRGLAFLGLIRKPDFFGVEVTDHPEDAAIKEGMIYIVRSGAHRKWAYMRCPDAPDEVIQLSLMKERRPNWDIKSDFLGRPSVSPSVRQLTGSYAHFWLRHGHVDRCPDHLRPPPPHTRHA
jgi:hypothetical protein